MTPSSEGSQGLPHWLRRHRVVVSVAAAVVVLGIALVVLVRGGGPDPSGDGGGRDGTTLPAERDPGPYDSAESIQEAVASARPGDDLVLTAGTYELALDIEGVSGEAGRPIRLRAEPGAEVRIVGEPETYALYMHDAAHWEIGSDDGALIFDGNGRTNATVGLGIYSGSAERSSNPDPAPVHDVTLRNVRIVDSGMTLVRIGLSSTDVRILDSHLSGSGNRRADFGEGIYIGSAAGEDRPDGIEVRNVVVEDVRAEAVDVKDGTRSVVLEGVTLRQVRLESTETNNKCAIAHRGSEPLVVRDTVIHDVRTGDDVEVELNVPCGIYVVGPIRVVRTEIRATEAEAVWVNNDEQDAEVSITDSTFVDNGGNPDGIKHESSLDVAWNLSGNRLGAVSATVPVEASPSVTVAPSTG